MKSVNADAKTAGLTELVRQDSMPHTRVLELRPLYRTLYVTNWIMESVKADIKTSPTEQVRQDRMTHTIVLELQPLYPILYASATKIACKSHI